MFMYEVSDGVFSTLPRSQLPSTLVLSSGAKKVNLETVITTGDNHEYNDELLTKIARAKRSKPIKEFNSAKEFFAWLRSTRK